MIEFQVRRADFRHSRLLERPVPELAADRARLAVKLVAMTSNNVTYAAMGEGQLGYYDFFPAPDEWGRPPAWGFAVVEASRAGGVAVGDRFYGFFPLGTHLDVTPAKVSPKGFFDTSVHRRAKSAVYNQYLRTSTDPAYEGAREAEQALFRPLYATGWWAADCIHRGSPSPQTIVLSSASAKTALAMAHRLRRLGTANLVALTSARSRDFVSRTGLFWRVATYDEVATLPVLAPAVFVDFLGRDELTAAVHNALGAALVRSVMIGATEWSAKPGGIQVPTGRIAGVLPEFFFVPTYAAERLKEDGGHLATAMLADMRAFYAASSAFVTPKRLAGIAAIETSWQQLIEGTVAPSDGLIVTL
jgi:hypothetical protein